MKNLPGVRGAHLRFFTTLGSLSCLVTLAGCAKESATAALGQTTPQAIAAPVVIPEPITSCRTSLIDVGQKGYASTTARGVYSDTKMIPGTSSPATAFADQTAFALKISYWDGSAFSTEVVSGEGSATFVRLAFTSAGIPMVFWTLGLNLKVAIRSAAFPAAGTWAAGIIDTGAAPRAVEVAVNPLDQVAVAFVNNSATSGRTKFLYCGAPCQSPAGFQTMTPNPYIENTNVIGSVTSVGVAWCKANSSTYYPAISHSVTGSTRYSVCLNSPASCLSNTSWSNQQIVATGNVASSLYLDPTVTGDVPKVAVLGASGIVTYRMGATPCSSAPAAFTVGATLGGSATGNQFMKLLKDAAGKFHLIANESTTAIRYFNSTGTDVASTWNGVGVVESYAFATAFGGGADIDPSTSGIYVSYGPNASPFDMHLSRVNDYTIASNLATYTLFKPDLTGNLQMSTAGTQLRNIAVAATSSGVPATAYVDYSVGANANAKLKYALRDGGSSSSSWTPVILPGTIDPKWPGLAFDSSNKPWISYFDGSLNRFYLATNSTTDGSGTWSKYQFPAVPSGAPAALPAANPTAVVMLKVGSAYTPLMIAADSNTTSKGVRAAVFNSSTRVWSAVAVIDGLTLGAAGVGSLAADADTAGNAIVAYQELNATRVRYAHTANGTTWTTPLNVSLLAQGDGVSVRINGVTGSPAIAYFDKPNNQVIFASCSGSLSACASGGWSTATVESAAGVSGLGATSLQLLSTSIVSSPDGLSYVAYPRGQANDGNLMLGHNFSGVSFNSVIAGAGANASLSGAPSLNYAVSGWGVAATRNAAGGVTSIYQGPGNWLYASSCGD